MKWSIEGLAISASGTSCVECQSSARILVTTDSETGKCPKCKKNEIVQLDDNPKNSTNVERCMPCAPGTFPDSYGKCEQCSTAECLCKTVKTMNPFSAKVTLEFQGNEFCDSIASEAAASVQLIESGQSFRLSYLTQGMAIAEAECRAGDYQQCQHLANMCVLQDYSRHPGGACSLLEAIRMSTMKR